MPPYSTKQKRFRQWNLLGWENSNLPIPVAQVHVLPGMLPRERARFGGILDQRKAKKEDVGAREVLGLCRDLRLNVG